MFLKIQNLISKDTLNRRGLLGICVNDFIIGPRQIKLRNVIMKWSVALFPAMIFYKY